MTEWTILNNLRERNTLMEGILRWKGLLDEELMTFHTQGGDFLAIPEIKKALPPIILDRFVIEERERKKQGKPPRLLLIPFLSEAILKRLDEEEQIMAVDLSGNGLIKQLPIYLRSSGRPNAYPDTRRTSRPYDKIAAQAAMILLEQKMWPGQKPVLDRIALRGGSMAKGQLSKLIPCYEEDGILSRPVNCWTDFGNSGVPPSRKKGRIISLLRGWTSAEFFKKPRNAELSGALPHNLPWDVMRPLARAALFIYGRRIPPFS